MTTDDRRLDLADDQALTDVRTLLGRLLAVDRDALVRLRADPSGVAVWAVPLGVVVRRDLPATMSGAGAGAGAGSVAADVTVTASALLAQAVGPAVALPGSVDAAWRVSLPPRAGWTALDDVPVAALATLADRGAELLPAATDPAALYDQTVLTVSSERDRVGLPLRVAVAMSRLGFLPTGLAEVARIAGTPAWVRVATRLGTAYQRRTPVGLGLG